MTNKVLMDVIVESIEEMTSMELKELIEILEKRLSLKKDEAETGL